jgi:hypothetical protein
MVEELHCIWLSHCHLMCIHVAGLPSLGKEEVLERLKKAINFTKERII